MSTFHDKHRQSRMDLKTYFFIFLFLVWKYLLFKCSSSGALLLQAFSGLRSCEDIGF
jgi:hypothetical protein